ncbi:MAG: CUB domain-containing protein, partial [Bacteroidales bacterium]|nr:CUB domain-containing protein [Bacteroidales bacterium]
KITIVWTDPAGDIPPGILNPTNKILVNDLDIRLTRQIDDHVFMPFVLDPAIPFQPAHTGDNNLDNAEQVQIEQPMAGFYTLSVSHKLSLSGGSQSYAMVITGLNKDYIASGYNILEEANGTIFLSSTDHYVNNMDVQWLIQPDNDGPVSIYFDYFETELSQDVLTIYDGKDEMAPVLAEFSGDLAIADTIVTSTFREMYVGFTSDSQVTSRGFLARYCSLVPEGEFSIIGEPYPCELSVSSYFAIGQEGTEFSWAVDEGWSFEQKSSNGIDLSIGDISTVLSLMPYNRCGSGNPSEITITPLTSQPYLTYLVGDTIPCAGHTTLLSTNSLPGTRFEWQLPVSWLGSSETDTIYYIPSASRGTVTVTGYNACGKGNKISRYIDVLDIPEKAVILTDLVFPCAYTVQDFYVQGTPGYDYLWEVQDDWEIIGESNCDTVTVRVGGTQNFIFLTSTNKCGDNNTNILAQTAPVPPLPKVSISDGSFGYPELRVTNFSGFKAIQWYRNGLPVPGVNGYSNPFIINLNGLYTVESISDQGCTNLIAAEDGIAVDRKQLVIRTYRINETTIVIENASSSSAGFNIVSLSGKVLLAGEVHPGQNEIRFSDKGIFLIQFYGNGIDQKYKVFF